MSREVRIKQIAFVRHHPVTTYFALTFTISWMGALSVAASYLIRSEPVPKISGILMFPVMLLGPSIAGIVLTTLESGRGGLRTLFSQMFLFRVPPRWYATLFIPPVLVLAVLRALENLVSLDYAPNRFFVGVVFALPAGFLEEIGWTGFAFPRMGSQSNRLAPAIVLGLLWAFWHLPVLDYLGTATPHRAYWLPFSLAFIVAMTGVRVLIAWIFTNTQSVFLAQLVHRSSTGALVVFGPPRATAGQEVFWYAVYGTALWLVMAVIISAVGKRLRR
jgi:membrane protease YdiL (CAAX protease family)